MTIFDKKHRKIVKQLVVNLTPNEIEYLKDLRKYYCFSKKESYEDIIHFLIWYSLVQEEQSNAKS